MTALLDVTPESTEKKPEDAQPAASAEKAAKPLRNKPAPAADSRPAPRVAQKEAEPAVKWIRLEKGGTYCYKRAIYQQ